MQVDADLSEQDIEEQVASEAGEHIPYSLEEVNLDFSIQGQSEDNPNLVDVLIVACRTEVIQTLQHSLEDADLNVNLVDVESYAIHRACQLVIDELPTPEETVGIFDIGYDATLLIVVRDETIVFSQRIPFGGQFLLEKIMLHYQLSEGQALKKLKDNTLSDDYSEMILTPFKEELVLQLRRALQFFFSSSQDNQLTHLLLCGGTSAVPDLDHLLSEELGITTSIADPFKKMSMARKIKTSLFKQHKASLLLACGLAMRSFDR